MCIQLLSALQTIHSYGLACRVLDSKHVLVMERNRYRIGSVGVMDILDPRNNIKECQSNDLRQLGCLLFVLATHSSTINIELLHDIYSDAFVNVVHYLLQGQYSASALLSQCEPHVVRNLNCMMRATDWYSNMLVRIWAEFHCSIVSTRMAAICAC